MKLRLSLAVCAILVVIFQPARARITGLRIVRVELPTFDGRSFGAVGQYEKLVGRMTAKSTPPTRAMPSSPTSDWAPQRARKHRI